VRRSDAQDDVVDTLLKLGLNREMATMSIPFVWFRVATTDPYSPVIIGIVHAIQESLRKMGINTRGDGFVDGYTSAALKRIAGASWKQKHWINVIDDVNFAGAHGLPAKEQAMGYLGNDHMTGSGYSMFSGYSAVGALSAPSWCSDRNPQGNCKAEKNICKPMDAATLGVFKNLQRQVNTSFGKGVIDVDGRIGPKTVSATNKALDQFPHTFGSFSHCDTLSARADEVGAFLAGFNQGKPPVKDPKGGSPPSVAVVAPDGSTSVHNPPSQAGIIDFVKSPIGMASVAGAVVLFLVMSDKKKKPKKKAKTRRRRRLPKKRVTQSFY
jgi:hypothetical protein